MIGSLPDPDAELPGDGESSALPPEGSLPEDVPSQPEPSNADAEFEVDADADFAADKLASTLSKTLHKQQTTGQRHERRRITDSRRKAPE